MIEVASRDKTRLASFLREAKRPESFLLSTRQKLLHQFKFVVAEGRWFVDDFAVSNWDESDGDLICRKT